jgi:rhodanese-related sulfurtransferase
MPVEYAYGGGMSVKRVPPAEAKALLDAGWRYVDVRSIPEFEAGHPEGAFNVPLMHFLPGRGMSPNPEFVAVLEKVFAKGDRLVFGCKSGGRSLRAAELLEAQGWTSAVDMAGGFEGERDAMGRTLVTGWKETGLPVATASPGRTYEELKKG